MTYREEVSDGGQTVAYLDATGYYLDGVRVRGLTAREAARIATGEVAATAAASAFAARANLSDALALADLYPAPSPEENALIEAQVATALAGFRALSDPPADVVALAAAVVSWRAEVVL